MNKNILSQISELKTAIGRKREAIESMCENLKYADSFAYSRDREKIKSAQVLLRSMIDELEELKSKAGLDCVPEKKAHKVKLFVYEKLNPYHPSNRFIFSPSEHNLNYSDAQGMVFVGTTEMTLMLNEINKEKELEHIRHRDELRMRYALEEKMNEKNYTGIRLNKKAS